MSREEIAHHVDELATRALGTRLRRRDPGLLGDPRRGVAGGAEADRAGRGRPTSTRRSWSGSTPAAGFAASGTRLSASERELRGRRLRAGGRARQRRALARGARRAARARLGVRRLARARRVGGSAGRARGAARGRRLVRRRGLHRRLPDRRPSAREPGSGAGEADGGGRPGAGTRPPRGDRRPLRSGERRARRGRLCGVTGRVAGRRRCRRRRVALAR